MYCTDCERHVSLTTGLRCMECGGGRIIATTVRTRRHLALDELARLGQEFDAAPEKEPSNE